MKQAINRLIEELIRLLSMRSRIDERIKEKKSDIRLYYEIQGYPKEDIDSIMSDYEDDVT